MVEKGRLPRRHPARLARGGSRTRGGQGRSTVRGPRYLALLVAVVAALAGGGARAAAPYPKSGLIARLTWDTASHRAAGLGGDLWPTTAGADGKVYTAWGDGSVTCRGYVSYGTAAIAGGPSTRLAGTGCAPFGPPSGKLVSLLDVAGTLFATVYLQGRVTMGAIAVWSSPN